MPPLPTAVAAAALFSGGRRCTLYIFRADRSVLRLPLDVTSAARARVVVLLCFGVKGVRWRCGFIVPIALLFLECRHRAHSFYLYSHVPMRLSAPQRRPAADTSRTGEIYIFMFAFEYIVNSVGQVHH